MDYLKSLFSLKNRIAVVTGAARGNGKAISEALLKAGATVIMADILKYELLKTVNSFKSKRLKAVLYECDITKNDDLDGLIKTIKEKYNKINILVNNAGVTFGHEVLNYPEEYWDKTYRVNLKAPFELTKRIAKL